MGKVADAAAAWAGVADKSIDVVREGAQYLARVIHHPVETATAIVTQELRYVLWARYQRLLSKTASLQHRNSQEKALKPVRLGLAVDLVTQGSLEEDDDLQDLYARLLARATDPDDHTEIRRAYVTMLKDFTPLDAKVLLTLYAVEPRLRGATFRSYALPDAAIPSEGSPSGSSLPNAATQAVLWNLWRLGCITSNTLSEGLGQMNHIGLTPLGIGLAEACSPPASNSE